MSPVPLAAADRCAAEVAREEARHAPGGVCEESGGLLLCRGAGRLPVNPNVAMRTGPGPSAAEVLARAGAFFGARGAGFGLHLRLGPVDDDLAEAVVDRSPLASSTSPALVREASLPPVVADAGIGAVTDAGGVADYAVVVDEAYQSLGWPPGAPAALFGDPALLLQPHKAAFVATEGGRPLAAAYVQVTDGLGLVSWVGTVAAARGRGLGAAVTVAATNAGFGLGADAVWLVASTMGAPLYRRLGFTEFSSSRSYVLWPALAEGPGAAERPGGPT